MEPRFPFGNASIGRQCPTIARKTQALYLSDGEKVGGENLEDVLSLISKPGNRN
jgi:hypothetical protein